jgi:hypothetical protein
MRAWNPQGFYLIKTLPKGMKFSGSYYILEILTPLVDWCKTEFGGAHQTFVIHADNARRHTGKLVCNFGKEN